jgi:hypothetical protein
MKYAVEVSSGVIIYVMSYDDWLEPVVSEVFE